MQRLNLPRRCASFALLLAVSFSSLVSAQTTLAPTSLTRSSGPYRKLAKGVIKVVEPKIEEEETFTGPRPLAELTQLDLAWQPKTLAKSETLAEMVGDVTFRRQVWGLEFGFKPLRMIRANVDGRMQDVYYLLYYVKNNGRHLNPSPVEDDNGNVTYEPKPVQHSIRFFPNFVLQAHDVGQAYMDDVMPQVVARIRQREDPNRTIYNSVTIGAVNVPVTTADQDNRVWGVATWKNVDPRSDFFSVFVQGLTNAYQWVDPPGAYTAGEPPMTGRRFTHKTLQLNFWRAGDAVDTDEAEIRYGVPNENEVPSGRVVNNVLKLYELKERVDHLWVYR